MGLSWADVKEWTDAGLNEAIAIAEDARKAASNQAAELASHKSSIASTGQAPSDMRSALDAIQGNLDARVNELSELDDGLCRGLRRRARCYREGGFMQGAERQPRVHDFR